MVNHNQSLNIKLHQSHLLKLKDNQSLNQSNKLIKQLLLQRKSKHLT